MPEQREAHKFYEDPERRSEFKKQEKVGEVWRYATMFLAGIVVTLTATWFTAWWNAATRTEVAMQFIEIKTSQSVMQKDLTDVKADIGFIRGRMTEQNELTARLLSDTTRKNGR